MINLFISILNMSLKASYVIFLVMLIRLLLKRAPKSVSYALWGIVAFRLTVPVSFESILSFMPKTRKANVIPPDIVYQRAPEIESRVEAVDHIINSSIPAANVEASVNPLQVYMFIASCIWALGVGLLLAYSLIAVIRLKKQLVDARLLQDNIFEAANLKTPFVLGIKRPRIYLPKGLKAEERSYIILHEKTHIRRKDHIIKIFAFIILAVHWFNPLVWLAFLLMSSDMELSCDEHVLKDMKEDIKRPYANSLLTLAMGKHMIKGSPLAFGEGNVKGRIKNVLRYKKPSFRLIAASILLVIIVSIALISNPKQKDIVQGDNAAFQGEISSRNLSNQDISKTEGSTIEREHKEGNSLSGLDKFYQTEYNKVKIKLVSGIFGYRANNEFETKNIKAVTFVDWILKGGERTSTEVDLTNNNINQYQITLSNELGESGCVLYYDTLYDKAFIEKDKILYKVEAAFARYIDSLLENTDIDINIEDTEAIALFEAYGWTLNYKISSLKQKINNINTLLGFNPNAYYFAYNNELSKDIGLDMSEYSNSSDITVDIYRIYESMPRQFYPTQNARAIVVKSGDKIIGAFISAGRHSAFSACSLRGKSFKEITGKDVHEWLVDMVRADELEEEISRLEPEQVIEEYILALDKGDAHTAKYYISKASLMDRLTGNMPNEEIYNEGISLPLAGTDIGARSTSDNVKSAKLIKLELINDSAKNQKVFSVTVDIRYKKEGILSSGEQLWNCHMVYEAPQTGWKIVEFGH